MITRPAFAHSNLETDRFSTRAQLVLTGIVLTILVVLSSTTSGQKLFGSHTRWSGLPLPSQPMETASAPDCTLLAIADVSLSGSYLHAAIRNDHPDPVDLVGLELQWKKHPQFPFMYASAVHWDGQVFWEGQSILPPTTIAPGDTMDTEGTWEQSVSATLAGTSTARWQVRFSNGPRNLEDYYHTTDFTGSTWQFSNGCVLTLSLPDSGQMATRDEMPTAECPMFTLTHEAFWNEGIVQFRVMNSSETPAHITGIDFSWTPNLDGLVLQSIMVGGNWTGDRAMIPVWEVPLGETPSRNASPMVGDSGWQLTPVVNAQEALSLWVQVGGIASSLQDASSTGQIDFYGTTVEIDSRCQLAIAGHMPTAASCGDGIRQPTNGEQCDNGMQNGQPGSTCDSSCNTTCGNNKNDSGEMCDDGNQVNGDGCNSACQLESCGDTIRQPLLSEQCDDGNTNSGDGCDSDCQRECGNGLIDPGEQCDDGNLDNSDSCLNTCMPSVCGDGILNSNGNQAGALEACDDGNLVSADGCDATCQLEPPRCGNYRLEQGEQCDDGNTRNNDGCDNACRLES